MAKDKKDKKHKKKVSKKRTSKQVSASVLPTFLGEDYAAEISTMRAWARNIHSLPVYVAPGGFDFDAESVTMALTRCHMRLSMLVAAWAQEGYPEEDAARIRAVRADMRVLAELANQMFMEIVSARSTEGARQ